MESTPSFNDRELAELAALADGSLPPDRRAEVEARIEADPELRALVDEQRRAVGAVRAAAAETRAPLHLRERVEADRRRFAPRARRRRISLAGVAAAALAAAALALVLTLPGGTPGAPTVVQAAQLGALPPTAAAPERSDGSALLMAAVDGVAYPYWGDSFAWESSGQRRDRLHGRATATVYYDKAGKRVGYTIVSGQPLPVPGKARTTVVEGTAFRTFTDHGRTVVTWLREGRTCVLSGVGVPPAALLKLAAWKGKGPSS
jgi:hypothetical protein